MKRRTNELISGVEYWRCKRQCGKKAINTMLGGNFIRNWSKPDALLESSGIQNLLRVADYLDVTVDQLFEIHSTAELEDCDHPQRQSKYNDPNNCLNNYRLRNGLSYQQLADRMGGISRQCVHNMCRNSRASQAGIERIARYEKMTPEKFLSIHGGNAEQTNNN